MFWLQKKNNADILNQIIINSFPVNQTTLPNEIQAAPTLLKIHFLFPYKL